MAYSPEPKREPIPFAVWVVVIGAGAVGVVGVIGCVVVRAILHATGVVAP